MGDASTPETGSLADMTPRIGILPPPTSANKPALRTLIRKARARGLVQVFPTIDVALVAMAPPTEREVCGR